ncbi:hypothetical protein HanOQP8_Chr12g0444371 [Helianthus annuus]|nr:hypothetical protein HanOQP8_Chr12g0444371 [Helianthus annuus]
MGARKDLSVSFSCLTQKEVEAFCRERGIGLRFNPVALGYDKSVDQCPSGSIALYCCRFEFSNLRHPFSTFVLNVLEYYRVSFGQNHPKGMSRVLHFEVLCRAAGYDPSLLLFRRFFHLAKNESNVPFKMVWRHPDAFLNEPEPSESDLDECFLKAIRECPSRVQPFPEPLLVLLGISKLWDKPNRDPVLMRSGQVTTHQMLFLLTLKLQRGEDAVARGSEHRYEDVGYVSVPNVKGFTKTAVPKALARRSSRRMLKSAAQSTSSDHVELSDDIEVSEGQGPDAEKEKNLVILGKKKVLGKKVATTPVQGSSSKDFKGLSEDEVYVLNWSVKIGDSFKDASADKLKADRETMDVQKKAFAEEKEGLKVSVVQATGDNQWLIEQGFQEVVTYLLHSKEFKSTLGDVYTKLLNYGKHLGLVAGFKLHESGQALEQSPLFRPEASGIFKEFVQQMERLTYPYVSEVSSCFGKPLSVLQELKPARLNEMVCAEVLGPMSKKRSRSGDSEETFSENSDVSIEVSLEGSTVGGDGGPKAKKAKKAKKGKGDGSGASKPSAGV